MKEYLLDHWFTKIVVISLTAFVPFYWDTTLFLISLIWGWFLTGMVISVFLHKYLSHKQFEFKHPSIRWLFYTLFVMSGSSTPVGWAGGHRAHHKYSDTTEDPYSGHPIQVFLGLFTFTYVSPMSIRDILTDRELMFIHKWVRHLFVGYVMILFLIDPLWAIYFGGLSCFYNIAFLGAVNVFMHTDEVPEGRDHSAVNIPFITAIFWGENVHELHHSKPRLAKLGTWDVGYYVIKLLGKNIYAVR